MDQNSPVQAPPQQGAPGQNCIFCSIAEGKIQSKQIYSDPHVIAILDINPANPGHVLVIPKKHYSLMMQIPGDEIGHIFKVCKKLSQVLLHAVEADGTNIFVANGALAGQKAPHFMVHIIPRVENDNVGLMLPEGNVNANFTEEMYIKILSGVQNRFGLTPEQVESFASVSKSEPVQQPVQQPVPQPVPEPQPQMMEESVQQPAPEPVPQPEVRSHAAHPIEQATPTLASPVEPHVDELDAVSSFIDSPQLTEPEKKEEKKGSILDSIGDMFK